MLVRVARRWMLREVGAAFYAWTDAAAARAAAERTLHAAASAWLRGGLAKAYRSWAASTAAWERQASMSARADARWRTWRKVVALRRLRRDDFEVRKRFRAVAQRWRLRPVANAWRKLAAVAVQRRKLVRAIQRMRNVERASAWARWATLGAHWFAAGERAAKADIHFRKAALRAASGRWVVRLLDRGRGGALARRRSAALVQRATRILCAPPLARGWRTWRAAARPRTLARQAVRRIRRRPPPSRFRRGWRRRRSAPNPSCSRSAAKRSLRRDVQRWREEAARRRYLRWTAFRFKLFRERRAFAAWLASRNVRRLLRRRTEALVKQGREYLKEGRARIRRQGGVKDLLDDGHRSSRRRLSTTVGITGAPHVDFVATLRSPQPPSAVARTPSRTPLRAVTADTGPPPTAGGEAGKIPRAALSRSARRRRRSRGRRPCARSTFWTCRRAALPARPRSRPLGRGAATARPRRRSGRRRSGRRRRRRRERRRARRRGAAHGWRGAEPPSPEDPYDAVRTAAWPGVAVGVAGHRRSRNPSPDPVVAAGAAALATAAAARAAAGRVAAAAAAAQAVGARAPASRATPGADARGVGGADDGRRARRPSRSEEAADGAAEAAAGTRPIAAAAAAAVYAAWTRRRGRSESAATGRRSVGRLALGVVGTLRVRECS